MVFALVLVDLCQQVFDLFLLLIDCLSVSLSIDEQSFKLLNELFHSHVEEFLCEILGCLEYIPTSFQISIALSQHFSCRGERAYVSLKDNLAISTIRRTVLYLRHPA